MNHYLYVHVPDPRRSRRRLTWDVVLIRTAPSRDVVVRMVPLNIHIRGRLLSAESGTPLSNQGVQVAANWTPEGHDGPLQATGSQTSTDERGEFECNPRWAFLGLRSQGWMGGEPFPPLHDIPAGVSPRIDGEDFERRLRQPGDWFRHGVIVDGTTYPIPADRQVTSMDGAVHTYVIIRHPAEGQPAHPQPITAEIRGPVDAPAAPAQR